MSQEAMPWLRPCAGTLALEHGKIQYDGERNATLVAGMIEGCTEDGVGVDLRLLRDAIDVAINRICPDAPKGAMCPARIWIDTNASTERPVVAIAGMDLDKDGRRPGVVIATTRTAPE